MYSETLGVELDFHKKLIVIKACGRIMSHNDGGKYGAVPASILRKCAFKFRMATSAAFLGCVPGGTISS